MLQTVIAENHLATGAHQLLGGGYAVAAHTDGAG